MGTVFVITRDTTTRKHVKLERNEETVLVQEGIYYCKGKVMSC